MNDNWLLLSYKLFYWDNKKKGAKIWVCVVRGPHLVHADAEVEVEPVGGREHQEAEREDQPRHLVHRHRRPPPPAKVIELGVFNLNIYTSRSVESN